MIVPYDVNFDEKVDRAAKLLIEKGYEHDSDEADKKARLVLQMAMRVEAEHMQSLEA